MTVKFNGNQINIDGQLNKKSITEFRALLYRLFKIPHKTGFFVFPYLYMRAKIGHSQHFGGAIKMMASPVEGCADELGRPFGFKKLYVVNSTVLPTIPASPTTTLAVANAIRIAKRIEL